MHNYVETKLNKNQTGARPIFPIFRSRCKGRLDVCASNLYQKGNKRLSLFTSLTQNYKEAKSAPLPDLAVFAAFITDIFGI